MCNLTLGQSEECLAAVRWSITRSSNPAGAVGGFVGAVRYSVPGTVRILDRRRGQRVGD